MNCRAVLMRADDLLDARMDPRLDQVIIEHASACPECARAIGELVALSFLACRASSRPHPGAPELAMRVMAEIRATKSAGPAGGNVTPLPKRALRWSGAVAACLAVFLVGLSVGKGMSRGDRQPAMASTSVAATPSTDANGMPASLPYIPTVPASSGSGWPGPSGFRIEDIWGSLGYESSRGWAWGPDLSDASASSESQATKPSDDDKPRNQAQSGRQPIVPRGQSRIRSSGGSGIARVSASSGGPAVSPPAVRSPSPSERRVTVPPESEGSRRIIIIVPGQEF